MSRTSGYTSGDLPDPAVAVLATLGRPLHGYAIMAFLDERGGPDITMGPATLYTTLKKLLSAGFIEEVDDTGKRRPYRRTSSGTAALNHSLERRHRLIEFVQTAMEEA